MINVTKTFLPLQEEYNTILKRAWDLSWITNRGILVKELEEKLKLHLGVSNILATTNGTIPLQIAIKALSLEGEIITTPFSYVATTSSIVWEGCSPVFVDIEAKHLTIDETKIESAITTNTTAILATHVFGNPCNVDVIKRIAEKHSLRVIYDAAHCFGVTYKGNSIFNYGDISTCSFHATKLFHTGEGGALFTNSEDLYKKMFYQHNFGHNGSLDFHGLGINGKMTELQAAMGLVVLPHINKIFSERKRVVNYYNDNLDFGKLKSIKIRENTNWNYSYYPVIFSSEEKLLEVQNVLNENKIFPRRYFYPSLNKLQYLKFNYLCPISENISKKILCLPLYNELTNDSLDFIVKIINKTLDS